MNRADRQLAAALGITELELASSKSQAEHQRTMEEEKMIRREIATAALQSIICLDANRQPIADDCFYAVKYADALIAELAK